MLRFLFFVLGTCVLLASSTHAGDPSIFLNFSAFLLVFVCALLFTLATHGPRRLLEAFVAGCFGHDLAEGDTVHHRVVLTSLRRLIYASAALGYLFGLVSMLSNLSDPSAIGPAIAVALLTSLYAVVMAEFLVTPMMSRLSVTDEGGGGSSGTTSPTMDGGSSSRGAAILGIVVLSQSGLILLTLLAIQN